MAKSGKKKISRRKFMSATAAAAVATPLLKPAPARAASTGSSGATVTIEPEALHALPLTQYSHFIEHLGQCIKGGIWAEGESGDMFLGGVRHELIAAMRSVNPALIRYPGGCFADGYHWQDGIGPRGRRPRRKNQAWAKLGPMVGPKEDNHFGTDEFIELCRAVGAEPMITANVGSGTAAEAAAWVEYCNGAKDTRWGAERAGNGHPDPYRVKYWFIGNEIFGWHEIGHQTPPQYVNTLHAYSKAMRAVDPDIRLIGVGSHQLEATESPNRTVLEGAGGIIDYLSVHRYVPNANAMNTLRFQAAHLKGSGMRSIYYDVMGSLVDMSQCVDRNVSDIHAYSPPGKKIPIAFDEWNLWFYFLDDIIRANYNLRDGLWTASMLNLFHRHAPDVPITNIAQMVNCLGIINSTRRGTFLTPSALVYKLYTEQAGENLLPAKVESAPLPHESGLPALDVSATRSGEALSLFLVNRHYDDEVTSDCRLMGMSADGRAERFEMSHKNPVRYNTFSNPRAVDLKQSAEILTVTREGASSRFSVRLAPHSLVCLRLRVKEL